MIRLKAFFVILLFGPVTSNSLFAETYKGEMFLAYTSLTFGEYKQAHDKLLGLAKKGNHQACNLLGNMYRDGNGVEQDVKKATLWYNMAASLGNQYAQYSLAQLYQKQNGTDDKGLALLWYLRAAEQGHQQAVFELGKMYDFGNPTIKDKVASLKWFEILKLMGSEHAETVLETARIGADAGQIDTAIQQAQAWMKIYSPTFIRE